MYVHKIMGTSLIAEMVKHLTAVQETWVWSLVWEDRLKKEMATHSSILAWKNPCTEEPGKLQSMGLQRVRPKWELHFHKGMDEKKWKTRSGHKPRPMDNPLKEFYDEWWWEMMQGKEDDIKSYYLFKIGFRQPCYTLITRFLFVCLFFK